MTILSGKHTGLGWRSEAVLLRGRKSLLHAGSSLPLRVFELIDGWLRVLGLGMKVLRACSALIEDCRRLRHLIASIRS